VLERTPSPWCSSARTGSHAMTQMTQRRRPTRATLELERCKLAAAGRWPLAWGLALRAGGRWPLAWGGGRARGHPVKITGSVRKKFFIF